MIFRALLLIVCAVALAGCTQALRKRSILVIGDSNGAARDGWVTQLQAIRGGGPLVNTSLSGNTLGFTDGGDINRNTLENLTPYLRRGYAEMGQIDEIIIGLGTNDCKRRFSDRHGEIAANLEILLTRTKAFFSERGQALPRVVLLTPPPIAKDDKLNDQFQGAKGCAAALSLEIRAIASREGYCIADLQVKPGDEVLSRSKDGIHFDEAGYKLLARALISSCY